MKSIAVVSTKGGSGKTAVAVSVACHWAVGKRTVLLDLDGQDTGSAAWWLDRTDDALNRLTWAKTRAADVVDRIRDIDTDRLVVDTPPSLDTPAIIDIASEVDLVVIPGAPAEIATIVQTARTVTAETDTPVAAVFTRALRASLDASAALSATEALESIDCPVIGRMRGYAAMMSAPLRGQRPNQIALGPRQRVTEDIYELVQQIEQRTTNA